ncbi:protein croquemort-like isoform X2 [Daktulosphaira vitifoliae]|uniref:protein croquemort-like isoform X2 n=1 Tax=Daktulosphaira vitifoliae TaxID=58002 RepID=UPI0021AA33C8|nr:protein croquemort-like isoform X2 [Daktulosphaira vitifoliae]
MRSLIATREEHKDSQCWRFWGKLFLSLLGIILLFTGIIMTGLWPQIFDNIMKDRLELKNNTQTYKFWEKIPVPLEMEVYLFNWTNPEDTLQNKSKPILQQLGPYVFIENRVKVNQTFNDNSTITYMQMKSWHFQPSLSNGSLSDKVITINIVLSVLGEKLKQINKHWVYVLTNYYLKFMKINQPYVIKNVNELLFDGYDDPILDLITKLKHFIPINLPVKKAGWLYGMNMSTTADGLVNMYTGQNDIEKVGIIHSVNYESKLNIFNKDCSYGYGSAGDLWPEHMAAQPNISLYIPNMCSAITLTNTDYILVNDIKGVIFAGGQDVFNNSCYCTTPKCQPPGVRSLNLCDGNSLPLFVSYPHFYLADNFYGEKVIGMQPNKSSHEFKIILQKDYSIPLHVDARLQFNVHTQPIKDLHIMKNLTDLFLPVFWFTESFHMSKNISDELIIVTNTIPNVIPYVWLIMSLIGSTMLIFSAYLCIIKKNNSFGVLDPI